MMSRDLSARPHKILGLKIKDVVFKTNGTQQYAEVLVNGKTVQGISPYSHPFPISRTGLIHIRRIIRTHTSYQV